MHKHSALRNLVRLIPTLILILSGLLMVPATMAQDGGTTDDSLTHVEFTGTIMAVENDTLLTVDELLVETVDAEVSVLLEIGQIVKVEGTVADDGTILATEVSTPDDMETGDTGTDDSGTDDSGTDDSSATLELVGTLVSLDASEAVVNGLTFDVTGAEIMAGLVAGDLVKVHANFDAETGVWMATELRLADIDGDGDVDETDDALGDDSGNDGDDDDSNDDQGDDTDDDNGGSVDDGTGPCVFNVEVSSANLRNGPGTGYAVIGFAFEDDTFPVTSLNSTGAWLEVTTDIDTSAWIAMSVGELHGACSLLPVSDTPLQGGNETTNGTGDDDSDDDDDGDDDSADDDGSDDDSGDDDSADDNGSDDDDGSDDDNGADDDDSDDDDGSDDDDDTPDTTSVMFG